jgi:hypothetical protein
MYSRVLDMVSARKNLAGANQRTHKKSPVPMTRATANMMSRTRRAGNTRIKAKDKPIPPALASHANGTPSAVSKQIEPDPLPRHPPVGRQKRHERQKHHPRGENGGLEGLKGEKRSVGQGRVHQEREVPGEKKRREGRERGGENDHEKSGHERHGEDLDHQERPGQFHPVDRAQEAQRAPVQQGEEHQPQGGERGRFQPFGTGAVPEPVFYFEELDLEKEDQSRAVSKSL